MTIVQNANQNPPVSTTVALLQSDGLPALPVAPTQNAREYPKVNKAEPKRGTWNHCPLDQNLQPLPVFTGKNPSYLDHAGKPHLVTHSTYQKILPTHRELEMWFGNPANGVGTLGGWDSTVWLDFDVKQFESQEECDRAVEAWQESHPELQETWIERTHSGGYRFALKVKQKPSFTNFTLEPGGKHVGEALGEGRFTVLAPTIGPSGNPYTTINQSTPVVVNNLESIGIYPAGKARSNEVGSRPRSVRTSSSIPGAIPLELLGTDQTKDILHGANPTGDRSEALTKAIREWYGWQNWAENNNILVSGNAEDLAHHAGGALGVDSGRTERILESIDSASCLPAAAYRGDEVSCWKRILRLDKATYNNKCPQSIKDAISHEWHSPSTTGKNSARDGGNKNPQQNHLREELKQPKQGENKLASYYYSVEDAIGSRLRLNTLSQEIEFNGEPILLEELRLKLSLDYNLYVPRQDCIDIVTALAKKRQYSPVVDYLKRVHSQYQHESTEILDKAATEYLGTSDNLAKIYLRKWFISAVARAMDPGSKVDTCLFLQGEQGSNKSGFFQALVPDAEWFNDSMGDIANKDELLKMHTSWINEWAELETIFGKRETSHVKAFLTSKIDLIRPPYGRSTQRFKRQSVIVGTTNRDDFLSDATGSRRFWVVNTTKPINLNRVREDRDRLWAAAMTAYLNGEQWWLTPEEQALSSEHNQEFTFTHPWLATISDYVTSLSEVTTNQILDQIKSDVGQQTKKDLMDVADCLKHLGWRQTGRAKGRRKWISPIRGGDPTSDQPYQPLPTPKDKGWSASNNGKLGVSDSLTNLTNLNQQNITSGAEFNTPPTTAVVNQGKAEDSQESYRKKVGKGWYVGSSLDTQGVESDQPPTNPSSKEVGSPPQQIKLGDRVIIKSRGKYQGRSAKVLDCQPQNRGYRLELDDSAQGWWKPEFLQGESSQGDGEPRGGAT